MKNKDRTEICFPGIYSWEKLLMRWSDFPTCGEKRLICAVIAQAIIDDKKLCNLRSVSARTKFFGSGLKAYCRMINLNENFVCEQVLVASSKVGLKLVPA